MKLLKVNALMLVGAASFFSSFSNAIEIDSVQKKLDQFTEFNSCTEESRGSKFPSVFLNFSGNVNEISRIEKAVLKTDFSEFEIGFDHGKGEYFYSNIFGKDNHFEQLHKECKGYECKFNMVMYPNLVFPDGHDNTDINITFYDDKNKKITEVKRNIGRFDAFEFEDSLIPFEAYMEDKTIIVTKMPSNHKQMHYVVGLHIGLDGKKHEIDVVVNKNQAEEGVLIGYPGYSDVTYLGLYFEPSNYNDQKDVSEVENKIELYDSEKDFFKNCNP